MPETRQSLLPLVLLAALVIISVTMLIVALAVWLAELVGSVPLTCLVIGAVTALLAMWIYRSRVRPALQRFNDRIATVYEVADGILRGYRAGVRWLYNLTRQA